MNPFRHSFASSIPPALLTVALAVLTTGAAQAEKADRDKPANLEADRVTVDDVKKVQVFEGNVQLTKGTLIIRAARLVVTQDEAGFQRGVATGGADGVLPNFRQKREGMEEYIEGEAERIEHDAKNDKTEFFVRAHVKSGLDEVRGNYISYDAKTENYFVGSGPNAVAAGNGSKASQGTGERVRAVIQPRGNSASAAAAAAATSKSPPLKLQSAEEVRTLPPPPMAPPPVATTPPAAAATSSAGKAP